MGQTSPASPRASEGKTSTEDAHGQPPDLPDPQTQGPTAWEPESVDSKARICVHQVGRPVLDEGARTHPDPAGGRQR